MPKGNKQPQSGELVKANLDFGKLAEEADDEEKFNIEDLPLPVQRRVKALKNIHKEHVVLEKQYREEVAELERKYQKLYDPLYLKRASIVSGEHEPTNEEARTEGEEPTSTPSSDKNTDKDIKGIPNFWLTVLKNNSNVGQTVTEEDEAALAYLQDVRCADIDKHGFALTFHFAENPFFTDSLLTKTYHVAEEDGIYGGELIFERAEGSKINWKPGKNLTVKIVKHTQKARGGRGKKGGATRVTTKEEPCDSFFLLFSSHSAEDVDEDEEDLVADLREADFEMGSIFKDKLIPHSVLWYTGEAAEFEDDFDDFGYGEGYDDEDEDDDDLDEDDDDDDDDDDDEPPRRGGRGQSGGKKQQARLPAPSQKAGAPGQPQQPECKQQ